MEMNIQVLQYRQENGDVKYIHVDRTEICLLEFLIPFYFLWYHHNTKKYCSVALKTHTY